ncbi:MAG TPA: radical SAM protein [Anaeromyxobacter sp.]|nr:radical SAM protein [Anaeromyxobacter sp.]
MARILLGKARVTALEQQALVPPMGLLYLASALRDHGHEVRVYEAGAAWRDAGRFAAAVEAFRPDVVGISALTIEAGVMLRMAAAARRARPGVPVIVGGPHPTSYPEHCLADANVDHAVVGEGEATVVELVDRLVRGGDPAAVPGVVSRGRLGVPVRAAPREPAPDLDGLPAPAWDLVDVGFYARHLSMAPVGRRPYLALVTSRGCPYRCIYCHAVHGKRYRARSPRAVLAEIDALVSRFGIREFEVLDDAFNLDYGRAAEILDGLAARRPGVRLLFPNGVRTDLLDDAQIARLRRAGTCFLSVAVETAVPRLQDLIRKHLRLDVVRRNIDVAVGQGMYVNGFFMLGFPTETLEEARSTVAFAVASRLHQALFFNVVPFAGTELAAVAGAADPVLAGGGVEALDYYRAQVNVSAMTDAELFGLQRSAYLRFYADPRRIVRIAASHPRRLSLAHNLAMTMVKLLPRGSSLRR